MFDNGREHLVRLAERYAVPAIYQWRQFVAAGDLKARSPPIWRSSTDQIRARHQEPRRRSTLTVPEALLARSSRRASARVDTSKNRWQSGLIADSVLSGAR